MCNSGNVWISQNKQMKIHIHIILSTKCHPNNPNCFPTVSTTWRSWRAAVWTMIIKRNVKVKSQTKRSGRPWRSSTSPKSCLKAPCTTCWKQMWVAYWLHLIHIKAYRICSVGFSVLSQITSITDYLSQTCTPVQGEILTYLTIFWKRQNILFRLAFISQKPSFLTVL